LKINGGFLISNKTNIKPYVIMKLYICKIDTNFQLYNLFHYQILIINWSNDQLTHDKKIKLSVEILKIKKIICKVNNHFGVYNPNKDLKNYVWII